MSRIFPCRSRWLAPFAFLSWPFAADAHIQWFENVDLSGVPSVPLDVMATPSFAGLALLSLVVLAFAGVADAWLTRLAPRHALLGRLDRLDIRTGGMTLMRIGMALFFIANVLYFRDAPVILTPELKSSSHWPDVLQLVTAAALLLGRVRVAAVGIVALFAYGALNYGLFHLSEYPIFLGIAAYLALAGKDTKWRARATTILRFAVALSLMWGGVEKWLFPQWIYPLLCGSGKALAMGLPPEFFVQASGFIEFCLSFVLIIGSVAARVAALAINIVFVAAMPMFGWVDVIGHAPFMLALVLVGRSPNPLAPRLGRVVLRTEALRWGGWFAAALGGLPALYFALHEIAFGRARLAPLGAEIAIALPVIAVIVGWLMVRAMGGTRGGQGA